MSARAHTLLEHAGRAFRPAILQDSVVVVIDAQLEYVDGRLRLDDIEAALAELAKLLLRARAARVPVVHVWQEGKPGGLFAPDGPGGRVVPVAAPLPGEPVLRKPRPNALSGTDLDFTLRSLGRRELVLAGFMTHMCLSATARAALDLGYRTTVVASATATRDLPGPDGAGVIPAAVVQRTALAELADRFAAIAVDVERLADGPRP